MILIVYYEITIIYIVNPTNICPIPVTWDIGKKNWLKTKCKEHAAFIFVQFETSMAPMAVARITDWKHNVDNVTP